LRTVSSSEPSKSFRSFFVLASQKSGFLETEESKAANHRLTDDDMIEKVDLQKRVSRPTSP
jgi:hypothetical protein